MCVHVEACHVVIISVSRRGTQDRMTKVAMGMKSRGTGGRGDDGKGVGAEAVCGRASVSALASR